MPRVLRIVILALVLVAWAGEGLPLASESRAEEPDLRKRIEASDVAAKEWVWQSQKSEREARVQRRAWTKAHTTGTPIDVILARGNYRRPLLTVSGTHRADLLYTRESPTSQLRAEAIILDGGGTETRRFPVVPFQDFLITEDGTYLVAIGNHLEVVVTDHNLHCRMVFYGPDGQERGRDEGYDISPYRDPILLEPSGLLLLGQRDGLLAFELASGERTWEMELEKGTATMVHPLAGGERVGVISSGPYSATLRILDPGGQVLVQRNFRGRVGPGGFVATSRDGTLVAIADIVDEKQTYQLIDGKSGEVIRGVSSR